MGQKKWTWGEALSNKLILEGELANCSRMYPSEIFFAVKEDDCFYKWHVIKENQLGGKVNVASRSVEIILNFPDGVSTKYVAEHVLSNPECGIKVTRVGKKGDYSSFMLKISDDMVVKFEGDEEIIFLEFPERELYIS